MNNTNNFTMAVRPSAMPNHQNQMTSTNSLFSATRPNASAGQSTPYTLEMLQGSGSYDFSGFDNSMSPYMTQNQNQQQQQRQVESVFAKGKEEQRDDLFLESVLF